MQGMRNFVPNNMQRGGGGPPPWSRGSRGGRGDSRGRGGSRGGRGWDRGGLAQPAGTDKVSEKAPPPEKTAAATASTAPEKTVEPSTSTPADISSQNKAKKVSYYSLFRRPRVFFSTYLFSLAQF